MSFIDSSPASLLPRRPGPPRDVVRFMWRWRTCRFEFIKRAIDIVCSLIALIALLPLLAVVALMIWFEDRGPILFWQRRVGLDGREFAFPKFRSMVVNAESLLTTVAHLNQHGGQGVTFKSRQDLRITRIGRLIRRTSVDELPQLWCVLNGDMTLVGPRPALPREVARYSVIERQRLTVTPGLTCIWQVSGRAEVPFPGQVAMDLAYIRDRSLSLDLRILCKTVPAVIRGWGAY
jgi:lipopolysaccharide/colanic/teichoic acid biosynthesis glycosyltransferase